MVRSRAEVLIDNWLYMQGIVHAYERRLPIEEECYCDFYLPKGVYIEFWAASPTRSTVTAKLPSGRCTRSTAYASSSSAMRRSSGWTTCCRGVVEVRDRERMSSIATETLTAR
jgi:hypothetical protein